MFENLVQKSQLTLFWDLVLSFDSGRITPPRHTHKIEIESDLGTLSILSFNSGRIRMWRLISVSPKDTISFHLRSAMLIPLG